MDEYVKWPKREPKRFRFTHDGAEWVCDGWVMVRVACPVRPTELRRTGFRVTSQDEAEMYLGKRRGKRYSARMGLYREQYAPLLRHADKRRVIGNGVLLFKAGALFAVVMCALDGTLDDRGEPA